MMRQTHASTVTNKSTAHGHKHGRVLRRTPRGRLNNDFSMVCNPRPSSIAAITISSPAPQVPRSGVVLGPEFGSGFGLIGPGSAFSQEDRMKSRVESSRDSSFLRFSVCDFWMRLNLIHCRNSEVERPTSVHRATEPDTNHGG